MPKISVIVPVYKVEQYLSRCVESVLSQTFTEFELILVDDGSSDGCPKICDDYAKKDARVVVIHKKNGGLSDARNAGIDWVFENSDSEWLTFIDGDDWIHEKYIETLYGAVQSTGCNISVCSFVRTDGPLIDEKSDFTVNVKQVEPFFCEHRVNAVIAWGKLYKKELFQDIRYPFGRVHEDEHTTHLVLFKEKQVAYISAHLYFYYQNPEGIMGSGWSKKKTNDFFDGLERQISFFKVNGFYRAVVLVVRTYILMVYQGLENQQSYEVKNLEAIKTYRSRIRQCLKYTKHLDVNNVYDEWLLYKVKPRRTKTRIFWRAVIRKLKK